MYNYYQGFNNNNNSYNLPGKNFFTLRISMRNVIATLTNCFCMANLNYKFFVIGSNFFSFGPGSTSASIMPNAPSYISWDPNVPFPQEVEQVE